MCVWGGDGWQGERMATGRVRKKKKKAKKKKKKKKKKKNRARNLIGGRRTKTPAVAFAPLPPSPHGVAHKLNARVAGDNLAISVVKRQGDVGNAPEAFVPPSIQIQRNHRDKGACPRAPAVERSCKTALQYRSTRRPVGKHC